MHKVHYWIHWLFQDLTTRKGKYVIAEVPNWPLVFFMISLVLSVVIYPGIPQKIFMFLAYILLFYWGFLELRGGRSRFRKLLGILGMISPIIALLLLI